MKVNVLNLSGYLLDWAIAKQLGIALVDGCTFTKDPDAEQIQYSPSTDESQAAGFIASEKISITNGENFTHFSTEYPWLAHTLVKGKDVSAYGETWPVAVSRLVLMVHAGVEVNIPDEMLKLHQDCLSGVAYEAA